MEVQAGRENYLAKTGTTREARVLDVQGRRVCGGAGWGATAAGGAGTAVHSKQRRATYKSVLGSGERVPGGHAPGLGQGGPRRQARLGCLGARVAWSSPASWGGVVGQLRELGPTIPAGPRRLSVLFDGWMDG